MACLTPAGIYMGQIEQIFHLQVYLYVHEHMCLRAHSVEAMLSVHSMGTVAIKVQVGPNS